MTLNVQYEWLWMNIWGPQGEMESLVGREEQWKSKKEKSSEMDWVCWGPDVLWMDQTSAGSARLQQSRMTPSSYLSYHVAQ